MKKTIFLQNRQVAYTYKRLRQARSLTITVKPDASVLVTTPYFFPLSFVERCLRQKASWILGKILHFENTKNHTLARFDRVDYQAYKIPARDFILAKIEKFNATYQFSFNKISVRSQTTLWGSCSKNKNLNFNYKLYFLPQHLSDYVVVHELCHLREFNHSSAFWQLVAQAIPNYRQCRAELRAYR